MHILDTHIKTHLTDTSISHQIIILYMEDRYYGIKGLLLDIMYCLYILEHKYTQLLSI